MEAFGRGVVAAFLLWLAAFLGALGTAGIDTCTGGSADPLAGGIMVLILNVLGMLLLVPGVKRWALAAILWLPALAAAFYTIFTVKLIAGVASGESACAILLGHEFPVMDGSEWTYVWQWTAACIAFWGGAALALKQAIEYDKVDDHA